MTRSPWRSCWRLNAAMRPARRLGALEAAGRDGARSRSTVERSTRPDPRVWRFTVARGRYSVSERLRGRPKPHSRPLSQLHTTSTSSLATAHGSGGAGETKPRSNTVEYGPRRSWASRVSGGRRELLG
jgi:hypothetical protein